MKTYSIVKNRTIVAMLTTHDPEWKVKLFVFFRYGPFADITKYEMEALPLRVDWYHE